MTTNYEKSLETAPRNGFNPFERPDDDPFVPSDADQSFVNASEPESFSQVARDIAAPVREANRGIIAEQQGIGAQMLNSVGVTLERARAETLRLVGSPVSPTAPTEQFVAQAAAPGYARSRSPYGEPRSWSLARRKSPWTLARVAGCTILL